MEPRTRQRNRIRWGYGLALLSLVSASGCGSGAPQETSPETILARDLAAEFATLQDWDRARTALAPLIEGKDAAAEDLLRAANLSLAVDDVAGAEPLLQRAAASDPENPVLAWDRYRIARINYDLDQALAYLDEIEKKLPDDVPTKLARAMVLQDRGEEGDAEAAEAAYRAFLSIPAEFQGSWRITALYRLRQLLVQLGRVEESLPFLHEFEDLQAQGLTSPGEPKHQAGTLGQIPPHTQGYFDPPAPSANLTAEAKSAPSLGKPRGLFFARLAPPEGTSDFDKTRSRQEEECFRWPAPNADSTAPDAPRIVVFGDAGLSIQRRESFGLWTPVATPIDTPVLAAVAFDRANLGAAPKSQTVETAAGDRDVDFLVVVPAEGHFELRLLENVRGTFTLREEAILRLDAAPTRLAVVDMDHDGDLDVLLGTSDGARLLRNDGFDFDAARAEAMTAAIRVNTPTAEAIPEGRFTDVTADIPFPAELGALFPFPEDVDGDNDVDFVLPSTSGRVGLLDDLRGGRFADLSAELASVQGTRTLTADFDGDGRVDIAAFSERSVTIHFDVAMPGEARTIEYALAHPASGTPLAEDLDLDGTVDLVWPADGVGVAGLLSPGFENGGVEFDFADSGATMPDGPATLVAFDIDGDGDLDLVRGSQEGSVELRLAGAGPSVRVTLTGFKDNALGVGAIVEARAGKTYRRIYWDGSEHWIATAGRDALDELRITWPNGVVQSHFDLSAGDAFEFWQRVGLVGSCPFLYTWNGETFTYVTDVLGITPLGLPMEPGMLVPPDHDEYVLVRGDQLVPKDGEYVLQFTEELREVTYLDRLRLDVVDHPADVEVFPNERFSFPPFPEAHTHTVRGALAPLSATDDSGRDWAPELAANDDELAAPFQPVPGQYQGLATPHTLELTFDADAWKNAPRIRLLMNGWLFWTDASVNVAAARHPEYEFVPPLLSVPDGEGGWRVAGPPLGFPAGKLKTMVIDVTELVDRDDPRIRLFSTLRLYWDSIRAAVDADDAEFRTTSLEPKSANLWDRGFSRGVLSHPEFGLEWFEWDRLEPFPRWNQHPGFYTRYGEAAELIESVDDRMVVMGAGDALTVRFDATEVPPLPAGWTRDYLVFLDGWAKDRDPNTVEALFVEPLPFHGMSGYPYGEDESFPLDDAHKAWLRDWQTRPAKRWIEPVAKMGGLRD